VLREGPVTDLPQKEPVARTARISKLMALALRFDRLISEDEIIDQAELARLGQASRAGVTQIMNLLLLALRHSARDSVPAANASWPRPHPRTIHPPAYHRARLA